VPATAERLHEALANLPVVIDGASCVSRAVPVPSYGGARPTSIVTLAGAGREGAGEHVGWTDEAHAAFRAGVARVGRRACRLGELSERLRATIDAPYDRAAFEMAAIELALRQRATTLGALAGVTPRPVRHVVSFARTDDPVAEAERRPAAELKVDADPAWADTVWRGLGALGRVAILDWKGAGDHTAFARAMEAMPGVLHEDPAEPWPEAMHPWLALDGPITTAAALAGVAPAAVNLKPARMGGVLEMLAAAARCAERGIAVYLGGMFEIDVGRRQLRDLAAVLCSDGPNDLAPISLADPPPAP